MSGERRESWWRSFFSLSSDSSRSTLEMLRRLYIEERQHGARFEQQAERMRYPQFRAKLLEIAADEARHADWIAERIKSLRGSVPPVPPIEPPQGNDWDSLLAGLEEHRACAAELRAEVTRLRFEQPDVAAVLQRICEDGARHRHELRDMLMRSDPQAMSVT